MTTVRPIRILGVNEAGRESGNAAICAGRSIPWLQDTPQAKVWTAWSVTKEDVIVLDADNHVIHVYNVSQPNTLADPAKYAELRNLLVGHAQ